MLKEIADAFKFQKTGALELEGMEFHAFHGCLEEERREGNTFVVDFYAETDLGSAGLSDDLNDTIDYARIQQIVASQMEVQSFLLENVADRIRRAIVKEFGKKILYMKIRVSKKNPPVKGRCAWSRVTMEYGKKLMDGRA